MSIEPRQPTTFQEIHFAPGQPSPLTLAIWLVLVVGSLMVLMRDLKRANPEIAGLMQWVWLLTVAYSGPLGLGLYFWSGRKQIPRDDLWRRAGMPARQGSACALNGLRVHEGIDASPQSARERLEHLPQMRSNPIRPTRIR
ncbi:hypothetical protein [Rhabdochromatium marinum]|uniref:hypothetical protein n=1 Tax=Rhabdochromatium marinum TaxID=48729 RepID=UPI001902CD62|nr:hypothetical protein [Rhabdochromatium marinum]